MRYGYSFLFQFALARSKKSTKSRLTSVNLTLLHVLPWHGVSFDNLGEGIGLEVLLARLLFRIAFPSILFHWLELVRPPSEFILSLFEKVTCLFAHFDHPVGRVS